MNGSDIDDVVGGSGVSGGPDMDIVGESDVEGEPITEGNGGGSRTSTAIGEYLGEHSFLFCSLYSQHVHFSFTLPSPSLSLYVSHPLKNLPFTYPYILPLFPYTFFPFKHALLILSCMSPTYFTRGWCQTQVGRNWVNMQYQTSLGL